MTTQYVFEIFNTLNVLEKKFGPLQLTGSRFFGTDRDRSDWDYFIEQKDGLVSYLEDNDFNFIRIYGDSNAVAVYRWSHYDIQIEIQIVKDLEMKKKIQFSLNQTGILKKLDKIDHEQIWDLCYRIYKGACNEKS